MFRRLYWIAEQVEENGQSKVTGVYTSIQDLVNKGLNWCGGTGQRRFRLTLLKPDSFDSPLGSWTTPNLDGLMSDLQTFIDSNEYTLDECMLLKAELEKFVSVPAV